jgi:hypothetical protein
LTLRQYVAKEVNREVQIRACQPSRALWPPPAAAVGFDRGQSLRRRD